SVVAAILLAITLAACGASRGRDGDTVTLTLSTLRSEAITQLARDYERVAPNVRVVISATPIDAYQTVLRTRLASGNAPDMLAVWPGNGNSMSIQQIASLHTFADLSGSGWARRLRPADRALLGSGGKVYLWSAGSNVIGALYDKAVFARAGASVPRT